jgi:tetratricopeptide (TPR) repeat protein
MAGAFLSYDRDDTAAAKVIATALETAGHSVWWDLHVRGGAQFSKVIEEALEAADAVVVLWSKQSIDSAWVRDEAAVGRDSGRLVPATIDGTEPPLGFRQFQTIPLTDWRRRSKSSGIAELRRALGELGAPAVSGKSSSTWQIAPSRWLIAVSIAAAIIVGALAWKLSHNPALTPVVAVGPADGSQASGELARDVLVKLGYLQSTAGGDPLQLVAQGNGQTPTLLLNIGESSSKSRAEATAALFDGRDRSLLWSKDFARPSEKVADLRQETAYTTGQVLNCALEGLSTHNRRLSQQSLKLYLNGCAAYADRTTDTIALSLVPLFRRLTRTEPTFAGGWAKLLLVESEFARMVYRPEAASILAALPTHIAAARRLDPDLPEAMLAEAALLPDNAFERRIALLERAANEGPDNAPVLGTLSDNLLLVGRMNDAVEQAQRAVRADPLSPAARDSLISALTSSGKLDQALAELQRSEQLWPGASSVLNARFRIYLRYGDAKEALKLVRSGAVSTSETPYIDSFLKARAEPTPANIERAVGEARSAYDHIPTVIYHFEQVLGTFGREEELFPILLDWRRPDMVTYVADGLFRPALRNFRRDPRMIAIAKRLGLLDYWRSSGNWPDFCSEPDLPYDCKKEAAKLK